MAMSESLTFGGRSFGRDELELMRQIAVEFSTLGVTEIARTVREWLDWKRPNGGLKNHECRQLLERLAAQGMLRLPGLRKLGGKISEFVSQEFFATLSTGRGLLTHGICTPLASAATRAVLLLAKLAR